MIDLQRAADAMLALAGSHHEMLQEELTAAAEQFGQRHLPLGGVEHIWPCRP